MLLSYFLICVSSGRVRTVGCVCLFTCSCAWNIFGVKDVSERGKRATDPPVLRLGIDRLWGKGCCVLGRASTLRCFVLFYFLHWEAVGVGWWCACCVAAGEGGGRGGSHGQEGRESCGHHTVDSLTHGKTWVCQSSSHELSFSASRYLFNLKRP